MICFQRNGGTPVPGCSGNDGSRTDYCIRQSDIGQPPTNPKPVPAPVPAPVPQPTPTGGGGGGKGLSLHFVGIDPPPSALPLGECEGDCDNDNEVRKLVAALLLLNSNVCKKKLAHFVHPPFNNPLLVLLV